MSWSSSIGWNSDGWNSTAAVVAAGTTWDNSNKFQITLTNGFLTATNSVGVGQFGVVRSVSSKSTGKFFVRWTVNATDGSAINFGICNASQSLSGSPSMGGGVNNAGASSSNGTISFNGGSLGLYTGSALSATDFVDMAIDVGGALFWFRRNTGGWNNDILANQNPATGTGGYSTSVSGALFLFCDVESNGCTGTLDPAPGGGPSGFGAWT